VLNVAISTGNKTVLDHGWIDLLISAVVHTRCNGADFGIKHFDLVLKTNMDESTFLDSLIAKHAMHLPLFQTLKHAVLLISPEVIQASEDDAVADHFGKMVSSEKLNGGVITGLSFGGLTDRAGRLQPKGLTMIREIAAAYVLVVA
jgi:hypothetical protein